MSVCVAWSLFAGARLTLTLFSSSLSSDTSSSSRVCLGRSKASTFLSVLVFWSLTILALALSSLGVDKQRGIENGGGEGEKTVLCLVRKGGREGIQKEDRLKRRKTNDFNLKKTDKVLKTK